MLRYTGAATVENRSGAANINQPAARQADHGQQAGAETHGARQTLARGAFVTGLGRYCDLSADEVSVLDGLARQAKSLSANHILFHEDFACDHVCVLVAGIACRYRMLPGGRRQILGYLLPGDICDIEFLSAGQSDHSVSLLTDSRVIKIAKPKVHELLATYPSISRAVSLAAMVEKATLRQWLLNVGQRNAGERLGHFLCEIAVRMEQVGYRSADDGSLPFSINQSALADTLGLTTVHVNRTLQRLRSDGLILLRQRRLTILEPVRLAALSGFDRNYLQVRTANV